MANGIAVYDIALQVTEVDLDVDHLRKQVRDAAAAAATTLVPSVLAQVYIGRAYPLADADLVACSIWTEDETRVEDSAPMGNGAELRRVELKTELRAKAASNAATPVLDLLDGAALELEKALQADAILAGLLWDFAISSTSTEISTENAEQPVGTQTLTWACVYRANPADPSVLA